MPRFLYICAFTERLKETSVEINHNETAEAKCIFGKMAKYLWTLDGCFSAESVVLRTPSSVSVMWTGPAAQLPHGLRESLMDG